MSHDLNNVVITNNTAAQRYEATVDGHLAVALYQRQGDTITFTHTEVPEELGGSGIASKLAKMAMDDARDQHLAVVPRCPFIAAYIRRHQEYAPLVTPDYQERVQPA